MPSPIESALITLLPTLNVLPPDLIDLSTSLLAQSYARAATLKPEEEIGRVFCCAHLGAKRLRKQLGGEEICVKPPVPPKVYARLLAFFDSALKGSVAGGGGEGRGSGRGTPRTPRHRDAVGAGAGAGVKSVQGTPSSVRTRNAGRTQLQTQTPTTDIAGVGVAGSGAVSGGRRSTRLPPKTVDSAGRISGSARKIVGAVGTPTRASTARSVLGREQESQQTDDGNKVPKPTAEMITALASAFGLPEAENYARAGCAAVLAARGYTAEPEQEQDEESSDENPLPSLSSLSKRSRSLRSSLPAANSASLLQPEEEDEAQEEGSERGRKRRRTGEGHKTITNTSASTAVEESTHRTQGPITNTTLPALIVAIGLFVVFTLKGEVVSGEAYNEARDVAIAAISSVSATRGSRARAVSERDRNEEDTKRDVAVFLRAAHAEGWLDLEWAKTVRTDAERMREERVKDGNGNNSGDGDGDLEMGEADDDIVVHDSAVRSGDDENDGHPAVGDESAAHEEGEEEQEEEEETQQGQQRTPRKKKAPAKTPLRRREKHAPRSSIAGGRGKNNDGKDEQDEREDDDGIGGLGRAGLKSGLGTMFHDGVDWLSEERCAEYESWEVWVRGEIDRIEGLAA